MVSEGFKTRKQLQEELTLVKEKFERKTAECDIKDHLHDEQIRDLHDITTKIHKEQKSQKRQTWALKGILLLLVIVAWLLGEISLIEVIKALFSFGS